MKINANYLNLNESYLFSTIAKKVNAYTQAHPEKKVLRMRRAKWAKRKLSAATAPNRAIPS